MRKILSLFAVSGFFIGTATASLNNKNLNYNYSTLLETNDYLERSNVINLSKIRMNDFETDVSVLEGKDFTEDDYLEEIKWAMISSNSENEDVLYDVWDSILFDHPDSWTISGFDFTIPKRGEEISARVRFKPENLMIYSGALSFKTTFSNNNLTNISDLIQENALGTILSNSQKDLVERIEKRNPDHKIEWSQLRFVETTKTETTLEAIEKSLYYRGAVNLTFKIGKDLEKELKVTNLGKFTTSVNEELILERIASKNPSIKITDIKVSKIDNSTNTAIIEPLGDDREFAGSVQVIFTTSNHISSLVSTINIGYLANPDYNDLKNRILSTNILLKADYFEIDKTVQTYTNLTIKANEASSYHGTYVFNFSTSVYSGLTLDSNTKRADAYNSLVKDANTKYISYYAKLGKNAFLKTYSRISFSTTLTAWHNGDNGSKYHDTKVNFSVGLNAGQGAINLFTHNYTGTNWMKTYSTLSYSWSGDYLQFSVLTGAEAYATAWNAYWARSEARTQITSLWFS